MRGFIVLCLIIGLLPAVGAACINPAESSAIRESALFCRGTYNLESGVKIESGNIVIDCNNSALTGNGIGFGVLAKDRQNVVVKNCNISNYEIGIYLDSTNSSIVSSNYLTKNKFGIALFNSFNNTMDGNLLAENLNDNAVTYFTASLAPQNLPEEQKKEEISTPHEVIEEVIRIKTPFLGQEAVSEEVDLIFNKYFATMENLEIERTFIYNESDKSTKIMLHLKPKRVLLNLSVYEKIPKCVAAYAGQILFETGGYEIVNSEPLILWTFSKLSKDKEISYKVLKSVDEECKDLLLAFGIASGFADFGEDAEENEEKGSAGYSSAFLIIAIAIVLYSALRRLHKSRR